MLLRISTIRRLLLHGPETQTAAKRLGVAFPQSGRARPPAGSIRHSPPLPTGPGLTALFLPATRGAQTTGPHPNCESSIKHRLRRSARGETTEAGGLMIYGVSIPTSFVARSRTSTRYRRVLSRPTFPWSCPQKFELVINLKPPRHWSEPYRRQYWRRQVGHPSRAGTSVASVEGGHVSSAHNHGVLRVGGRCWVHNHAGATPAATQRLWPSSHCPRLVAAPAPLPPVTRSDSDLPLDVVGAWHSALF